MRIKSRILIIVIAILLYFLLTYVYNKVSFKNSFFNAYILKDDVGKGEEVNIYNLQKIEYRGIGRVDNITFDDNLENLVYNANYEKGKILTKDMTIEKEEYIAANKNKEIVAIKVNKLENNLCSVIKKGAIVNVYVSAKVNELANILNSENTESFSSSSVASIATIKFIENAYVINVYDVNGSVTNDNAKIDSILIEVDKSLALKINNLKMYAEFSLGMAG